LNNSIPDNAINGLNSIVSKGQSLKFNNILPLYNLTFSPKKISIISELEIIIDVNILISLAEVSFIFLLNLLIKVKNLSQFIYPNKLEIANSSMLLVNIYIEKNVKSKSEMELLSFLKAIIVYSMILE
jgi:hypothetical protein